MNTSGGKRILIKPKQSAHTHEQRVGLRLVIGIASFALLMGVVYIGSHLTRAFHVDYDGPMVLTPEQQQQQALLDLQNTDSDGDGLTDYEEIYGYRTNPYLADTDGDGISDYDEIFVTGTDPNCPEGEECGEAWNEHGISPVDPNTAIGQHGLDLLEDQNENLQLLDELMTSFSAVQIRQFLVEAGLDEEEIASYSDSQVMELYQTILLEMEASGELDEILNVDSELYE